MRLGGLAGQPAFVDEAAKGDQRADEEAQRAPAGDEAFAQAYMVTTRKTMKARP